MANNTVDSQRNAVSTEPHTSRDVVDSQPSTPQNDDTVRHQKDPARWAARWRRGSKAAPQPSNRAEIKRQRAPTLPDLPIFPSLPDFEEGTCGDQRLSKLFSLNTDPSVEKSLPELPWTDGKDNIVIGRSHNRGNAVQSSSSRNERNSSRINKGKDVPNNRRDGQTSSAVRTAKNIPLKPSRLIKRNGPRRVVTEDPVNKKDRSNPLAVQGRSTFVSPLDSRSLSVPTISRVTVGTPAGNTRNPDEHVPRKPFPIAMCQSPGCPITHPHPQGLYLHNDQLSQWKHPYWGISNPPHHIWQGWDRRTDKIATPQEVGDVIGFMENHSYGPHGKVKERATPEDYKVVRKERGETWAGGFF